MARHYEIVDGLALSYRVCFADDFTVEFVDDSVVDESKLLQLELKGLKVTTSHFVRRYRRLFNSENRGHLTQELVGELAVLIILRGKLPSVNLGLKESMSCV